MGQHINKPQAQCTMHADVEKHGRGCAGRNVHERPGPWQMRLALSHANRCVIMHATVFHGPAQGRAPADRALSPQNNEERVGSTTAALLRGLDCYKHRSSRQR